MAFAQIGPLTTLMQNVAAGVGAGMLLGGFAAGLLGLIGSWPRRLIDHRVLKSGYAGGLGAAILMLVDSTLRYAL